ncbi:hypothetical protein KP509_09G046600 [Ceratopteris richardii]|nr:hypothetical protein KP509_09G046600 [Ceratopteris richardii]KAH7429410.1 hypothetical protein KP509_09G046600 [Ceratopteris richardii]KAH7429411.1 hypothetical protein KP509_09G046600 [Ceratopteris richardii]KAH7429412.1 hypothetical protein KP509_09G046600 [Ceratopteris richardii]
MSFEVTQILLNAQSLDGSIRKLAEDNLKQLEEQNFPIFLLSLAHELANNEKPAESRRLAGLILKNSLDAKEASRKLELVRAWISLVNPLKSQIKSTLLMTLASPVKDAGHTAAQVIAKVAAIELPLREWPELVGSLLANMGTPQDPKPAELKQATLETLGYVCEEISPEVLAQEQVNSILTAVVHGMNTSESDNDVRLAATRALCNALDFAQSNFDNDMERDYIMRVICEATFSPEVKIRLAAFECLVSISSAYYSKLSPYMGDLFTITSKAVREDEEGVALQALEFWSSICDEEIEAQEEYGADFPGNSEVPYFKFIKQALPALVPLLLATLTKQEEDQDQEEGAWNLAMAGGTCLGLVARAVGDDIIPLVLPYVQENITKPDWRSREAATYAFGSILEGPSLEQLTGLVRLAFDFILNAVKDENTHVKDTTAWTLRRIFEFLHGPNVEDPVVNENYLPLIMEVLSEGIKDIPNVAEKICGAIYFLAQGYEEIEGTSSPLSPYIQGLIQMLLASVDREDAGESRLRTSAYETLNEIVRCSTEDTSSVIIQLLPVILQKLSNTIEMPVLTSEDREKQSELQGSLCGVLQVIIQKLSALEITNFSILQYADQMMSLFLRVFSCRNSTVHEEAMLAIGALAYVTGVEFAKYMQDFYKYLEMGLQNYDEYQVCAVTVGVVGDICRALDDKILPFCDGIVTQLLNDLSNDRLHRSVKPPIFSCLGDIALAIGENFEKYLVYSMHMLQGAAELSAEGGNEDDELIDYYNQLRHGILEAYSGILQGFKNTKSELMVQYAGHILQFIERICSDPHRDHGVTKAAAGVLGDLADTLGPRAAILFQNSSSYQNFLLECQASDDQILKETAQWALAIIGRVLSQ